jgi:hypothetical protein
LLLLPTLLLSMDRAFTVKSYREPLIAVYDEEEETYIFYKSILQLVE